MSSQPDVSVVIAALNSASTIEAAIESVKRQADADLELVIVDGGSQDGTVAAVRVLMGEADSFLSEPDTGIYQAWNKALARARGRYVCFLGADDRFVHDRAVARLLREAGPACDLVTSKARYLTASASPGAESGLPYTWGALAHGMMVEHRGLLHRRGLFAEHGPFDESFRIAGDYEFLLRCGPGLKSAHVDEVLVAAGGHGVSQSRYVLRYWERARAQSLHGVRGPLKARALALLDSSRMAWYRLRSRMRTVL